MSIESTALAIRDPQALATPQRRTMRPPLSFNPDERQMIRDSFMPGASEPEAKAMIAIAEHMRLDPFKRQIHFVKRWNADLQREVWAFQTAIDGFRSMAEDTGEFIGSDEPEFNFEDRIDPATGEPTGKKELVARVRVYRKDFEKPFVGIARYTEFVQTKKDGSPNSMWARAPRNMLAKCAEAQAFRKAFPQDLAGVYSDDEVREERDVSPPSVVRGDVRPLQSLPAAAPVDAEVVEKKDWPAAFRAAADESALATTLSAYQKVKERLTTGERKAAQEAFKARKGELEAAARTADQKEPEHDPATGEVVPPAEVEREPGAEG
jgi:phage recombination protein Bet